MSDFMKWLYLHYIRPELHRASPGEYEMWLSLFESNHDSSEQAEYEKVREFTAIHAFLLGLRTGAGLKENFNYCK